MLAVDVGAGRVARVSEDEYVLDTPVVREFVAGVRATIAASGTPAAACDAIRPRFATLLADPDWLPARYQEGDPESGMGGGIGQWLLFRAGDRSLTLFALVVPPGSQTPIHDHLAWGLVGLYRGTQDEEIYAHDDGGALERVERARSRRATSTRCCRRATTSTACARPRRRPRCRCTCSRTTPAASGATRSTSDTGEASPFRSGYVNVDCEA